MDTINTTAFISIIAEEMQLHQKNNQQLYSIYYVPIKFYNKENISAGNIEE